MPACAANRPDRRPIPFTWCPSYGGQVPAAFAVGKSVRVFPRGPVGMDLAQRFERQTAKHGHFGNVAGVLYGLADFRDKPFALASVARFSLLTHHVTSP